MTTNHPSLSPTLGRSNVATLATEYRRLEMEQRVPAAAEAYRRAGELLMMMWRSAVIATDAINLEISENPLGDDEAGSIRRRLEQLWHDAKLEADEVIDRDPGTDDSARAIAKMEVIADLIEDLEDLDLVPTITELLDADRDAEIRDAARTARDAEGDAE